MGFYEEFHSALARDPEEVILEYKGRCCTRSEMIALGNRVVALLDEAGVPEDASVGVVTRNRLLHATTIVGLIAADRRFTTVYAFQSAKRLTEDVTNTRFAAVIADEEDWSSELIQSMEELGAVGIRLSHTDEDQPIGFVPDLNRCTVTDYHRIEGEPSLEVLSSGTTGRPKRVKFPFRMLAQAIASTKASLFDGNLPADLAYWPFGGIGGLIGLVSGVAVGRYMSILDRFNVPEVVEQIRKHRPSIVSLMPAAAQMIIDANVPAKDLDGVKYFYGGSGPMSQEIKDTLYERYGITTIWAYGATEFCGTIISWSIPLHEQYGETKKGSMGKPLPGIEVRVVDVASGEPLPIGEQGYLEAKVPLLGDHWIHTTDLAMIDEDGFVYHRGRGDGAIIRGGFKVLPEIVNEALVKHPSVLDSAVVGLPDRRLGQVPVAAVQLRTGTEPVTGDELKEFLRDHLPSVAIPTMIQVVEALPRTPSLKTDLKAVAALFAHDADQ